VPAFEKGFAPRQGSTGTSTGNRFIAKRKENGIMGIVQWDPSLSVGVDMIDEQHKKWIGLLNSASEAAASGFGPSHVAQRLDFLIDYTRVHFSTEESHMSLTAYPGRETHAAEHEKMRATLAGLVRDFEEEGATHALAGELNDFLGNWLKKHILDVDMRFGEFLRERNI
jgi:hemerythrin